MFTLNRITKIALFTFILLVSLIGVGSVSISAQTTCEIPGAPWNLGFPFNGRNVHGDIRFSLTVGCNPTVTPGHPWFRVSGLTNEGTVIPNYPHLNQWKFTVTMDPLEGTGNRSSQVTISAGNATRTIGIIQFGCSLNNPTSYNNFFYSLGGSLEAKVSVSSFIDPCPAPMITRNDPNQTWVEFTTPTLIDSQTNTYSFIIKVKPNAGNSRSASLKVNNSPSLSVFQVDTCPIPALNSITDSQAQLFEAEATPTSGRVDINNLSGEMLYTYLAFKQAVEQACNCTLTHKELLSSAWRPQTYQNHIRDVYLKWQELRDNKLVQCQIRRAAVYDEITKHGLWNLRTEPASVSNHTGDANGGTAIDVKYGAGGVSQQTMINLARTVRYGFSLERLPLIWCKDEVHFRLKSGSPTTESPCLRPRPSNLFEDVLFSSNAAPLMDDLLPNSPNLTEPSNSIVSVQVSKQIVNNEYVYSYRVINNDFTRHIVAVQVGYNRTTNSPQLQELPADWTPETGIPSSSATSPTGWNSFLTTVDENERHSIQWRPNDSVQGLPSSQSLSGFSVILLAEDATYQNSNFNVVFEDGLTYQGVLTPSLPTAASVSVSGRVVTAFNRGINGARVTIADENGEVRTTQTNAFGYYRFTDVAAGKTYTISVAAKKRYTFTQQAQILSVAGETNDVNFIAEN